MASLPNNLPIAQLESLKFKANQIIESIQTLQRIIDGGNQPYMPPWPDILSKYNMLLSQTHSFSNSLVNTPATMVSINAAGVPRISVNTGSGAGANAFERIALHPSHGMTDAQLDGEVIPLLRNQQTTDVLRMENETVRRLAEHMVTKGSVGVLGGAPAQPMGYGGGARKPEYEDVLGECEEIRGAHDRRVERAVRAVAMLRDKFDWKQRVEVEVEEPEELDWDPRFGRKPEDDTRRSSAGGGGGQADADGGAHDVIMHGDGGDSIDGGSSDEDEVEGELVHSSLQDHEMPSPTSPLVVSASQSLGVNAAVPVVATENPSMNNTSTELQ